MLLPLLQAPSSSVEACAAWLCRRLVCRLIVLCHSVSQSISCCIDAGFPLKSTSDLARGVGLVCLEALESNQGGGQGRVNLNVLRRSQQTHHSGFC